MADVLALIAAFLFALAAALQQREAMDVTAEGMSVRFFLTLMRRPVWLAGTGALLAGYAVQAAALADGRLVVIQPLLVTTIVFALPLGIVFSHQVVHRGDWIAAAGVVAALAGFIVVGAPAEGRDDAPGTEWLAAFGIVAGASVLAVLMARNARPERRAALLGAAAGMLFGIAASLAKPVVEELGADGVAAAAADWRTWALLGAGGVAFALQQGALAVGRLAPAVAATSLANPVVASLVGALILQETLAGGPLRRATAVGLLVAAGLCAISLAARGSEPARRG